MAEENYAETWLNSIIMDIFKHEKEPINCKNMDTYSYLRLWSKKNFTCILSNGIFVFKIVS